MLLATVSLKQLGAASQHSLQMLYATCPPGADTGPEPLSNDNEGAGIVIEGTIEVSVGDSVRVLNPGDG